MAFFSNLFSQSSSLRAPTARNGNDEQMLHDEDMSNVDRMPVNDQDEQMPLGDEYIVPSRLNSGNIPGGFSFEARSSVEPMQMDQKEPHATDTSSLTPPTMQRETQAASLVMRSPSQLPSEFEFDFETRGVSPSVMRSPSLLPTVPDTESESLYTAGSLSSSNTQRLGSPFKLSRTRIRSRSISFEQDEGNTSETPSFQPRRSLRTQRKAFPHFVAVEERLGKVEAENRTLNKEKGRLVQTVAIRKKRIGEAVAKQLQIAESEVEDMREEIETLRGELKEQASRAKEVEQRRASEQVDLRAVEQVWQKDVMENMQRWMDKQAEATQLQIEAIRSEEARRRADLQAELQLMREQQAAELQRIQERQIEELQRVQERQAAAELELAAREERLRQAERGHAIQRRGLIADNNTGRDTDGAGPPPPTKLPSISLTEILQKSKGRSARTMLPVVPRPGNLDPPINAGTLPQSNTANAGTLSGSDAQPEPSTSASASTESGQPQAVTIAVTGPNSLEALAQLLLTQLNLGGIRPTPDQSRGVTKNKPKSKAQSSLCDEKGIAKESKARNHHLSVVRELFMAAFDYKQDKDITSKPSASYEAVEAFEKNIGPGPERDALCFDMVGETGSRWNLSVERILLQTFLEGVSLGNVVNCDGQTEAYWKDAIRERFKKLRDQWRRGQYKMMESGEFETDEQYTIRMISERDVAQRAARHLTRRRTRYLRHLKVIELEIAVKRETEAEDLQSWIYLRDLIIALTPDGFSSDQTGTRNGQVVYYVKVVTWRNEELVKFMETLEKARVEDRDLWDPRGGMPGQRLRRYTGSAIVSKRRVVQHLPRALYSETWLNNGGNALRVKVDAGVFQWAQALLG